MAELTYIGAAVKPLGFVAGRASEKFTYVGPVGVVFSIAQDFRILNATTGTISDQVVVKAGGIDVPFENGRVWLLRASDGRKTWEGWSDAAGGYTATGLELGVAYIPVAIDPAGVQKATAAGPVIAQ